MSKFCKHSQLKLSSDADIVDSWNRMAERFHVLSSLEFNQWQQATGVSYSPHGLLSSSTLQRHGLLLPASLYCHDYMHTMCSNGIMVDALYLVLEALFSAGYLIQCMGLVGPMVVFMGASNSPEKQKVAKYRKDKGFKCNASEMLTLYKPLQYFLEVIYMSNSCMVKECRSFSAWCQLLDYLQSIPSLDSPCLVESALECHTLAGFADYKA